MPVVAYGSDPVRVLDKVLSSSLQGLLGGSWRERGFGPGCCCLLGLRAFAHSSMTAGAGSGFYLPCEGCTAFASWRE